MATQNTLCLEDGIPRRLRQLLTTVILNPAARSIGRVVVFHTGFALEVQKERVFSMTNTSGLSMHAILVQATATCALGSPGLCKPHELNAWHGGLARMHSRPVGTDEQMSSTSWGLSRSPLMKGEPKLIAWYFCTLLHLSTLNTTVHPQRAAATFHPPAPAHRSRTLTWPLFDVCSRLWSFGFEDVDFSW